MSKTIGGKLEPDAAAIEALMESPHWEATYRSTARARLTRVYAADAGLAALVEENEAFLHSRQGYETQVQELKAENERLQKFEPKPHVGVGGDGIVPSDDPLHDSVTGCLCNHCQAKRGYYPLHEPQREALAAQVATLFEEKLGEGA